MLYDNYKSIKMGTLLPLLLLLNLANVGSADLMCYVCEDCEKIMIETPLLECNDDYFNSIGTELPSTQTTTIATTVETSSEMTTTDNGTTNVVTTTTTDITSTTMNRTDETTNTAENTTDESTTEQASSTTVSMSSTTDEMTTTESTATTVPIETTEGVPTPPTFFPKLNIGNDDLFVPLQNLNTTTIRNPKFRRETGESEYSYHCYSIRRLVNNNTKWTTERGCERIENNDGDVCIKLIATYNGTTAHKCNQCNKDRCNTGSTLTASMLAMAFAVFGAVILNRL